MAAAAVQLHLVCVILLTQVVPSPHLRSGQRGCSVWRSHVARKIIQARWLPVVARYNVSLPLTCPLHPARHKFGRRQPAGRPSRAGAGWRCGLCGRQFGREVLLDYHYRASHPSELAQQDETLVCPAHLCDILRCNVYSHVLNSGRSDLETTDLQTVEHPPGQQRAVQPASPRHLQKYTEARLLNKAARWQCTHCVDSVPHGQTPHCVGKAAANNTTQPASGSWWWWKYTWWWVDDVVPASPDDSASECEEDENDYEFVDQTCDPDKMERLRIACEDLIADCISPLILDLFPEEFRALSEELSRATCWYLACGRYWERSPVPARALPWVPIVAALTVLTLLLWYIYYLLCVGRRERLQEPGRDGAPAFIQVSCPHELKRRLLERTVSREPARPRRPNDLFAIYDGDYELAPPNHVDY